MYDLTLVIWQFGTTWIFLLVMGQTETTFFLFVKIVSRPGTLIISDNVSEQHSLGDFPSFHIFFFSLWLTHPCFFFFFCCNVVNMCLAPFDARFISSWLGTMLEDHVGFAKCLSCLLLPHEQHKTCPTFDPTVDSIHNHTFPLDQWEQCQWIDAVTYWNESTGIQEEHLDCLSLWICIALAFEPLISMIFNPVARP